jgi:hypothetical protein
VPAVYVLIARDHRKEKTELAPQPVPPAIETAGA